MQTPCQPAMALPERPREEGLLFAQSRLGRNYLKECQVTLTSDLQLLVEVRQGENSNDENQSPEALEFNRGLDLALFDEQVGLARKKLPGLGAAAQSGGDLFILKLSLFKGLQAVRLATESAHEAKLWQRTILLEYGGDIARAADNNGLLPVHVLLSACESPSSSDEVVQDALRLLLELYPDSIEIRADVAHVGAACMPVHLACASLVPELVQVVVGVDTPARRLESFLGETPHLLRQTAQGQTPLHIAAEALSRHEADAAALRRARHLCALLVSLEPSALCVPDGDGETPLHKVSRAADIATLRTMLDSARDAARDGEATIDAPAAARPAAAAGLKRAREAREEATREEAPAPRAHGKRRRAGDHADGLSEEWYLAGVEPDGGKEKKEDLWSSFLKHSVDDHLQDTKATTADEEKNNNVEDEEEEPKDDDDYDDDQRDDDTPEFVGSFDADDMSRPESATHCDDASLLDMSIFNCMSDKYDSLIQNSQRSWSSRASETRKSMENTLERAIEALVAFEQQKFQRCGPLDSLLTPDVQASHVNERRRPGSSGEAMLHEVLLGVLGHEGALLETTGAPKHFGESHAIHGKDDENADNSNNRTPSRVRRLLVPEVLSDAEARCVEELARAGTLNRELRDFLAHAEHDSSLTVRALCTAVRDTLQWHLEKVCEIERKARDEPGMPLSRVRYLMGDTESVLERVCAICEQVRGRRLRGGRVLDLVYVTMRHSGVRAVQDRLANILQTCLQVLVNLAETWMVHGILLDREHEFFVQERAHKVHVPARVDTDGEDDDDDGYDEDDSNWANLRAHHPLILEYEWKSQFRIRDAMLPTSFFSRDLADLVLFVGKATRVLRRSQLEDTPDKDRHDAHGHAALAAFLAAMKTTREASELDMVFVGRAIRTYYKAVAQDLQNLVVKRSGLVRHLTFARDFFLLGQGAFFSFFIELSRGLFASDPRAALAQAELAINAGPWRDAAEQAGIDSWPEPQTRLFHKLRLLLQSLRVDFRSGFGQPNAHDASSVVAGGLDTATVVSTRTKRTVFSGSASSAATSRSATSVGAAADAKSPLSSLVLVGDARARGSAIIIGRADATTRDAVRGLDGPANLGVVEEGGLWHGSKLPVERGFQASVKVCHRARPGAPNDFQVSLCFQHDPMVGPTPLRAPENSISFVARIASDFSAARLLVIGQRGETLFASESSNMLGPSAASTITERTHRLSVAYKLQGQDKIRYVAQVELRDDEDDHLCAQLQVPLSMGKEMRLEKGSGRAWTGVLLSGPGGGDVLTWFVHANAVGDTSRAEFDPWRTLLNLHMHVDWPLHLVLTQNALDQYGMMFRFLLSLRRVEIALKEAWALLNQTRFKRVRGNPAQMARLMTLWRLRSSMAYWVNNLQYHLQVDVVDAAHKTLLDEIRNASDFKFVEQAHDKFVETFITGAFLHNKTVRETIDHVLRRCLRFCSLVERFARLDAASADGASADAQKYEDLDKAFNDLAKAYARDAKFLYQMLLSLNSNMLLRIDFNGFFDRLAQGDIKYTTAKHSYAHQSNSAS
ncbi:Gamma-tubulin complex component 4 [Hondaea fermentalgiana]|uniref:Gamma-tubulin complex component 4 n=1 Tax=Hondaea fermentalgiana TaxID=2315210 RepID=A0A2R5GLN9_9STRA|nr:Gamma-tubulin complex component 4 [Hondaea fermentalgiana]|eukprot:GBG28794.1 Gamma-tubulin complex component 4 [Hondaea fermentalgiana]